MVKIRKAKTDDLYCQCGNRPVVVLDGGENCYYCGNEIPLCEECLAQLKKDLGKV